MRFPLPKAGLFFVLTLVVSIAGLWAQDCDPDLELSCISSINVTLNADCQSNLVPAMVLSGNATCINDLDFEITIADDDPSNGSTIDGCGSFTFSIQEVLEEGDNSIPFQCWGIVTAEDKTSPVVIALPQVSQSLYCDAVDPTNISLLPANVSRCWLANGTTGVELANSLHPALRARLLAGGGLPTFYDGCSDIEICVNDVLVDLGDCADMVITRTFTATDGLDCQNANGEENAPAVASYEIIFTRPELTDIEGVNPTAVFECDETYEVMPPNQYGDRNPAPDATDYPFFDGGNQTRYLTNNFCSIGATFEDGPRTITCAQTYKFVRTFTVVDWCMPGEIETFTQLVKVGDFEAPTITPPTQDLDFDGSPDPGPLFYSTSNQDCSANFLIPAGAAIDNCDANPSVIAFILPNGNPNVAAIGPFPVGGVAFSIPAGDHLLRYIASDACDNSDTLDIDITIGDRTSPVAICENGLDISIGGAGVAILRPEDIDQASSDECSEITRLIAFVDNQNLPIGGWQESITLTCDMIGTVAVGLLVTDSEGNSNSCWLEVLVEDKLAPLCLAPSPQTTTCSDPEIISLPQDLTAAMAENPAATSALLDEVFGAANGLDNCVEFSIDQIVVDNRNSCGVGPIIRSFIIEDAQGLLSAGICSQTITVLGVHDYSIRFPADANSEVCVEPDYNAVSFEERGCDLITTTTDIDTFAATADECYKLRITYEVLNWCEYSTEEEPYVIPRDADDDNLLEEPTWLHLVPAETSTLIDDVAYLDNDANRFNGFIAPLDQHDPNGLVFGSSVAPYGTDEARGAFLYRQFIKVYDEVAPVFTIGPADPFEDIDGDCAATVVLGFDLFDECTSAADYSATAEIDAFFQDIDDNDLLNLADFVPSGAPELQPIVMHTGGGVFSITFAIDLPLGEHAVRIRATDGCGNSAIALYTFEVVDRKAPTPICINGLTATLMPDGEGGGMAAIWASEYVASTPSDCNGPIKYAIYRSEDAAVANFQGPMVGDTGLVLNCDDLGLLAVRVYAIDAVGNSDYCETTLLVQAFQDHLCDLDGGGNILGYINTEVGLPVPNVEVDISNDLMSEMYLTDNEGLFNINGLPLGDDYTIQPRLDVNPINGVTTMDLLTINYHLIDFLPLASPYQLIAADVDDSEIITILDLVAIRMLILGINNTFEGNTSWRFVDADYNFSDPAAPWDDNFPEVANFNNLAGTEFADFVAIKIGDVNNSAVLGLSPTGEEVSANNEGRSGQAQLYTEVDYLPAGELVAVPLYTRTPDQLAGLQGTFELAQGVELVSIEAGVAAAGNFGTGMLSHNWLTFSYDDQALQAIDDSQPLATLFLRSEQDISLVEALYLGSAYTQAEAYTTDLEIRHLQLTVGQSATTAIENRLYQNMPNPFIAATNIGFELANAGPASLEIHDLNGRLVSKTSLAAQQGYNSISINRFMLGGQAGLYTYTLRTTDFSATRKLLLQ